VLVWFDLAAFSLLLVVIAISHMVNWRRYNQLLVRRGEEVMLDFDVIDDGWQEELLEKMNDGKKGAQYKYPNSFICPVSRLYESILSSSIQTN
jgi:hypothetical protein